MRSFLLSLFILCSPFILRSQFDISQKVEFGWWLGGANYLGEISAAPKNVVKSFKPGFGIYNRVNFNPRITLKSSLNFGTISGADSLSGVYHKQARNLSFRTNIFEAALQLEFNFFKYLVKSNKYSFSPYISIGIGVFRFNPQTKIDGEIVNLKEFGTEGQNVSELTGVQPYNLTKLAIPISGGIKYNLSSNISINIEVGFRYTFTDYLDDVSGNYVDRDLLLASSADGFSLRLADRSGEVLGEPIGQDGKQRGDNQRTDAYVFSGIGISYTFTRFICPWPSGLN